MTRSNALGLLLAICVSSAEVAAEVPLPDTIVYGTIELNGNLVGSGNLAALVSRTGLDDLWIAGEFTQEDGIPHYVIRVPMETQLGAPGPSGLAARNGDVLTELLLDDTTIAQPGLSLQAGEFLAFTVGETPEPMPEPMPGPLPEPTPAPMPDPLPEPTPEPTPEPGPGFFVRADCSGDGNYDLSDSVFALNFLFLGGTEPKCEKSCDGNDDGDFDLTDGVFLLNFLFLGGPPPAEPRFPVCGTDPTADSLSCNETNCLDGEGGGAGLENFMIVAALSAPAPSPETATGDTETLDERSVLLALSPREIDLGALSGRGATRTVTLSNLSPTEGFDLSIASTSERFSVSPASFYLQPQSSLVVICQESTAPPAADDDLTTASIRITENDLLLGRVPLQFYETDSTAVVELSSVVVDEEAIAAIEIPIEVSENVGSLHVTFDYDEFYFLHSDIVAAEGVEWVFETTSSAGTIAATAYLSASHSGGVIGHLVVTPQEPLAAGTYPVSIFATTNDGDTFPSTHGEVCAETP